MAKLYPFTKTIIFNKQDLDMQITLNEAETQAVIQAGLEAKGMLKNVDIDRISGSISRTGTKSLTVVLVVNTGFGTEEDTPEVTEPTPKVAEKPVAEAPEPAQEELPLTSEAITQGAEEAGQDISQEAGAPVDLDDEEESKEPELETMFPSTDDSNGPSLI